MQSSDSRGLGMAKNIAKVKAQVKIEAIIEEPDENVHENEAQQDDPAQAKKNDSQSPEAAEGVEKSNSKIE